MRSRVSATRTGSDYDLAVALLSQECAKTFVQMWRESPGHMTNMMSSNPLVSVTSLGCCLSCLYVASFRPLLERIQRLPGQIPIKMLHHCGLGCPDLSSEWYFVARWACRRPRTRAALTTLHRSSPALRLKPVTSGSTRPSRGCVAIGLRGVEGDRIAAHSQQ